MVEQPGTLLCWLKPWPCRPICTAYVDGRCRFLVALLEIAVNTDLIACALLALRPEETSPSA